MNDPKKPLEPEPLDEQAGALLAAYDEALSEGVLPAAALPDSRSLPPRLLQLQALLHRLEDDRRGELTQPIADSFSSPLRLGQQFGRFWIVRELGSGGWGIVFLAWDPHLHREVALKVPNPEALRTPEHTQRFLREARAAAGLDHPNLVPVFEAGEVGPVWYIASAYCPGATLAAWLRERQGPVAPRTAAELLAVLAEAMEYTHRRGILHRDLKPGNVLLQRADHDSSGAAGKQSAGLLLAPGTAGLIPRITDFGLACFCEPDDVTPRLGGPSPSPSSEVPLTRVGSVVGTLHYMAPEQAGGAREGIGPATDVYALGAILHEVLIGLPPFRGATEDELLRALRESPPVPLRKQRRDVPRDLEAICLRCLEKDPARRYPTAGALAHDLRQFLDGKPIAARPMPAIERLAKWARRRPAVAALVVVVVLAGVGTFSVTAWHNTQLRAKNVELGKALDEAGRQRGRAEERQRSAQREAYAARMGRAADLWRAGRTGLLAELLNGLRPFADEEDPRGFEWYYLWNQTHPERFLRGHRASVRALAFSPDGRFCASAGDDGTLKLWHAATGQLCASVEAHSNGGNHLVFSPTGGQLASAGVRARGAEWRLWDVVGATLRPAPIRLPEDVRSLTFAPDGRLLVLSEEEARGNGGDRFRGLALARQNIDRKKGDPAPHTRFSPDGRSLAVAFLHAREGWAIQLLDPATGRERATLLGHEDRAITKMVFTPDGRTLASLGERATIKLWDVARGKAMGTLSVTGEEMRDMALSPDGRTLHVATFRPANRQGRLWRWDLATRRREKQPRTVGHEVHALALAPDGTTVALGCQDHLVRLSNPSCGQEVVPLSGHTQEAWAVAFLPDGRTLASGSDDHTIKLWDTDTGKEQATLEGHTSLVSCLAVSANAARLASGGFDHTVRLWTVTGEPLSVLEGHTGALRALAFAPDGRTVASGGKDRTVRLWDVVTGQQRRCLSGHPDQVRALAYVPGGQLLASASNRAIWLWDLERGVRVRVLPNTGHVWAVASSPDGRLLAGGNEHGLVHLWDVALGTERLVLRGHTGGVRCLAFSPDGRTLATGGQDRTVRLWQVLTGHELLTLPGQPHEVNSVDFAADGSMLAAALHDGSSRLWKAPRDF